MTDARMIELLREIATEKVAETRTTIEKVRAGDKNADEYLGNLIASFVLSTHAEDRIRLAEVMLEIAETALKTLSKETP